VADGSGATAMVTFTWTIVNVITAATTGPSPTSPAHRSARWTLRTDSSPVARSPTRTAGPSAGLAVDPGTGAITGTPTTGGSYAVTVTAADDAGYSATDNFTWVVTNTVTATDRCPVERVGHGHQPVTSSATDTSSRRW